LAVPYRDVQFLWLPSHCLPNEACWLSKWPTDIKHVKSRILASLISPFVSSYTPIVQNHMYPSHRVMDSDLPNSALEDPVNLLFNCSSYGARSLPRCLYIHSSRWSARHFLNLYLIRRTKLVSILVHSHPVIFLRNTQEFPSQPFPRTSPCLVPMQARKL
jgi:hypothetical protein